MEAFTYKGGVLCAGDVPLTAIAEEFGTPCYVYVAEAMTARVEELRKGFGDLDHRILYAVKANSNLAVLQHMAQLGCGFDVVSIGELKRVVAAGGKAADCAFSGVGKTREEIEKAIAMGVGAFHIESYDEFDLVCTAVADADVEKPIDICARVNPEIDVDTHPHIATALRDSKFGVDGADAVDICHGASRDPNLRLRGLACHIGSQLLDMAPLLAAARVMLGITEHIRSLDIAIDTLDLGGGPGVSYKEGESSLPLDAYAEALIDIVRDQELTLQLAPGRSLVAEAGVLLTRVVHRKCVATKNFMVVDAAMTELLRPALYDAWHAIRNVIEPVTSGRGIYDVVGPVCESGDFLGRDRELFPSEGALLAVSNAGAYAASLASTYNSRPLAAEVLVKDGKAHEIRRRGTHEELYALEKTL